MRSLFAAAIAGALAAAAPASAQSGSIGVSLTIVQPAAAEIAPALRLRSGRDGLDVSADLRIRGAAVVGIAAPATEAADGACSAWRAEPVRTGATDAVSVRTRCAPQAGSAPRTTRAPMVITLATN
ncbi:MAG TPA: hypothetical protein VF665_19585 [Longimicrobium sp.]|jgi:hypothetical protein|uniref:hypothetical protein n=1 Tax=Longimicrobium sp. TaxID=2029185 RepID=UPI002EDA00C7